jgi:Na+-translocating ferredoxin:NAD+ oxidoreductase subunit E
VVISGLVTVMDRCILTYFPAVHNEVGLYIQLIVAFASILAGVETFASKSPPVAAFVDGVARGSGFLIALVIISALRELLGKGTLWGYTITQAKCVTIFAMPAGGFFVMGLLMALVAWYRHKNVPLRGCGGCVDQCIDQAATLAESPGKAL